MGSKQLCLNRIGAKNLFYRQYFGKTSYNDLVFARNEFLRLVGPPNESLILIIIYYMFKYLVGIKQVRYSHFGSKKVFYGLYFDKTSYNDLVFARNEFSRLVEAPNESLILIIIYYMFKYSVGIKTTLLESLRRQKSILKAIFRLN